MKVQHWNEKKDGPFSEDAMRDKLREMGFASTKQIYTPGTIFKDHVHESDKIEAVISGRFRIETKEGVAVLSKGDYLEVPAGTVHSAEVIGYKAVVSLDAVRMDLDDFDDDFEYV